MAPAGAPTRAPPRRLLRSALAASTDREGRWTAFVYVFNLFVFTLCCWSGCTFFDRSCTHIALLEHCKRVRGGLKRGMSSEANLIGRDGVSKCCHIASTGRIGIGRLSSL
uniref:Uncharacterized protein n=1 Tax=Steinernema glaseri TaxID=37863 RepID=A0A1I7YJU8_9BILA